MERVSSKTVYEGPIADVRIDRFRHPDGEIAERQVVSHPGAVAMIAHDDEFIYLVRQPREATGEADLLEVPAGKLDVEGESELDCAKRELAEEIAKHAAEWTELKRFYTSPGFTEEEIIVYLATGLSDADTKPDPEERLEVVGWPLSDLAGAIAECRDSKSLVAMLLFERIRDGGQA